MPENNQKTKPKKNDEKKKVPRGLYQKPIRRQGGLIGSRELTTSLETESTLAIPSSEKGALRVLVFGGVGEIGKNLYALEYADDIIILDCGLKFPEKDTPGVDFLVPNIQYLEERKKTYAVSLYHTHTSITSAASLS